MALRLKPNMRSAAGLNSMMLPVSSMTMMASSDACSMVWRMISLTWASESERSTALPIAMATISTAAFSSSVQSRSTRQSLMAMRAPQMAMREDRDREERLDLLVLEIRAQEALDIARAAGKHLALAHLLGQPLKQRVRIDDRLDDGGRRAGHARRSRRRPNRPAIDCARPWPGSSRSLNRIARCPPSERASISSESR